MSSIIIALPKIEDAKKIKSVLVRRGFSVPTVCNRGAAALAAMSEQGSGVLIAGCRLPDLPCKELLGYLPESFELLLIGSESALTQAPEGVLSITTPLKVVDLVNTIEMMQIQLARKLKKAKQKPKQRSWKEQNYIGNAKMLLMERNHLSEEEAFRYIQKCSMDSGTNMVETAQMILMLLLEEN